MTLPLSVVSSSAMRSAFSSSRAASLMSRLARSRPVVLRQVLSNARRAAAMASATSCSLAWGIVAQASWLKGFTAGKVSPVELSLHLPSIKSWYFSTTIDAPCYGLSVGPLDRLHVPYNAFGGYADFDLDDG